MKTRDLASLVAFGALAVLIWLRDRTWFGAAEEVLPALAALPLFWWLGQPWQLGQGDGRFAKRWLALGCVCFFLGIALNLTLLLAAGWTSALWAWLRGAIPESDHQRIIRLLVLPFVAYPWITLDLQPVGWSFRLSGAWVTEMLLSGAGLQVTREGTHMLVQGMPVSVDASCSGLKVLQSLLVAGTLLAYSLLGRSRRYWWNVIGLLPLAWLANTARIVTISLAALTFGPEFAMGLFHSWGGLMVLVLMFLVCWLIFRFQQPRQEALA